MKLNGERVREGRERLALSIVDASAKARVAPRTWIRAERGEEIMPSSARSIAEALGVAPAVLREEPAVPLGEASPGLSAPPEQLSLNNAIAAQERSTLEELLEEGAGTHYLALPYEELEAMYDSASFEEARELTMQINAEQRVINQFVAAIRSGERRHSDIAGHWIMASQQNRWVSAAGMQQAAQREIDQAREAGDEERAERIREAYGLAVQEILGVT